MKKDVSLKSVCTMFEGSKQPGETLHMAKMAGQSNTDIKNDFPFKSAIWNKLHILVISQNTKYGTILNTLGA